MQIGIKVGEPILDALKASLSPPREGARPRMSSLLPHIQLDQWPSIRQVTDLINRARGLRDVICRQSRMASPGTEAMALTDACDIGPAEAFIDPPEFCHLRAPPRGGLILTLPPQALGAAIDRKWGEQHPVAITGALSPFLVTVYAPRDDRETAACLALVELSWKFARGEFASSLQNLVQPFSGGLPASPHGITIGADVGPASSQTFHNHESQTEKRKP